MHQEEFSLIIPTFRGLATLPGVLESLLRQNHKKSMEVIVVLDGPDKELEYYIKDFKGSSGKEFNKFIVKVLGQNEGRFSARYKGAMESEAKKIIFIDDRTELGDSYMDAIVNLSKKHNVIISNIIEKNQPNIASKSLYYLRKKIYREWGDDFTGYEINQKNFDSSAKGTAGLVVDRDMFLDACGELSKIETIDAKSSDDTKLLRALVNKSHLFRAPEPKLYYVPRQSLLDELRHIYRRGPLFVDYYLKKGSHYLLHLCLLYLMLVVGVIIIITNPFLFLLCATTAIVGSLIFVAFVLKDRRLWDILEVFGGLMLVSLFFTAGVAGGTLRKIYKYLGRKI